MKIERWNSFNNKNIVIENEKAIVLSDEALANKSKKELQSLLVHEGRDLQQQRERLVKRELTKQIKIAPREIKQYFLDKGDMKNYDKADELESDNPSIVVKKIKNEISFFGKAFLEGFLEVYNIKLDNSVEKYEKNLQIIEEESLDNGRRNAYIGRFKNAQLERITPDMPNKQVAKRELDLFYKKTIENKKNEAELLLQTRKENENE